VNRLNKIRILIVEDDIVSAMYIESLISKERFDFLGCASSVHQAEAMIDGYKPDLIVGDIQLGNQTIFLLSKVDKIKEIPIILITGNSDAEYFEMGKAFTKSMFMAKPINQYTFLSCIEMMIRLYLSQEHKKDKDQIVIRGNLQQIVEIDTKNVVVIKSEGNYSFVLTNNGRKYVRKKSLSDYMEELSQDFVRIHKSYIINKNYISEWNFENRQVQVMNYNLTVGRSYRKVFNKLIDNIASIKKVKNLS
jgi:DNA-binding LytR/AlgR family response regulator